jgi:hypothetical protein
MKIYNIKKSICILGLLISSIFALQAQNYILYRKDTVGGAGVVQLVTKPYLDAHLKQNKFNITLSDATSGNQTITLPTAVGISGNIYFVKKIDSSANTVTINTTSSQTIDGATSRVIYDRYSSYMVVSDGSNWYIISTF